MKCGSQGCDIGKVDGVVAIAPFLCPPDAPAAPIFSILEVGAVESVEDTVLIFFSFFLFRFPQCNEYILDAEYLKVLSRLYEPEGTAADSSDLRWPLLAGLSQLQRLPPVWLRAYELDPLRDQCAAFVGKLAEVGVSAEVHTVAGLGELNEPDMDMKFLTHATSLCSALHRRGFVAGAPS